MIPVAQIAGALPPRYEFATLGPWADQPGVLLAAAALGAVALVAAALLYWRERASLSPVAMLPLLTLRVGALIGVALYGLAPEKRDAREETQPSRVIVIVDDSLSMALEDSNDESQGWSRAAAALAMLRGGVLDTLREKHEVHVAPASDLRAAQVLPMAGADAGDESDSGQAELLEALPEQLAPRGAESRLGDALEQGLTLGAGGPLAGLVLVSDGQNNAGASPELVSAAAGEAGTPVFTIGQGSETASRNLAVRDLIAPRRAYPKDEIQLTAVIELQGYEDASGVASLFVRPAGDESAAEQLLETQSIEGLNAERQTTIHFTARPEAPGGYEYRVSVRPLPGERQTDDNSATAEVQVADRLLKVLIVAGGPNRDYHFLRDQLRRDDAFLMDVWLQSAPARAVQDAEQVLDSIPSDEEKLKEYDLFVALDADWTRVPRQTIAALERCVSKHGAGVLFATGPVHTPRWLRENDAQGVMSLLPVKPAAAPLLLGPTERTSPTATRIRLTRAGEEAPPLWVLGDQQASVAFWQDQLEGFYTTAEVESVKPGAVVYAEAADSAEPGGGPPKVVFAEQFFGAGRCFYIGAPEIWRLRKESTAAMRAFYTKLLQHLSQGRLLADSPGGSLLFERDRYNVGETISLRATLTEVADDGNPTDSLIAQLELPGGEVQSIRLTSSEGSPDIWTAGLRAQREGLHRASLSLPLGGEPLTAKTQVLVPALERSQTRRNTALLTEIAAQSGGRYYPTAQSVSQGEDGLPPLSEMLVSRSETILVYGAPDEQFARRVARWLLTLIAGCLLAEWALRRALGLA